MDTGLKAIVCIDKNQGIGYKNTIPWFNDKDVKTEVSFDQTFFKNMTINKRLLMGYCTYKSLPKPLPHRDHIVVTSREEKNFVTPTGNRVLFFNNIYDVFIPFHQLWVIGGQSLYEKLIRFCDTVYVSKLDAEYECDRHFPLAHLDDFDKETLVINGKLTIVKYRKVDRLEKSTNYRTILGDNHD